MRLLAYVGSLRTVVAVLSAVTALYMGLVAFGNITDYGTNHAFVQHVLAMDTTFKSPNMMWRAITDPGIVTAVYVAIIAWEALTALVLAFAFVAWIRALPGGRDTTTARHLASCGWLMMVALFLGGFITIGGEWFQMWQSSQWNGLQPALQNFLVAALGLVLVHLAGRRAAPAPNRDTTVDETEETVTSQ